MKGIVSEKNGISECAYVVPTAYMTQINKIPLKNLRLSKSNYMI